MKNGDEYVVPNPDAAQQRAGLTDKNLAAAGIFRTWERQYQKSDDDASSMSRMSTITARTGFSNMQESAVASDTNSLPGLIFCAEDIRQARENGVVSLEFSCSATSQLRATNAELWTEKILSNFHGVEAEIKYTASLSVVHVCLRHDDHPAHTLIKYLSDNNFFDPERGNKVNYHLNLRRKGSKEFEADPQSGDEIIVSEGITKHSKRPPDHSRYARNLELEEIMEEACLEPVSEKLCDQLGIRYPEDFSFLTEQILKEELFPSLLSWLKPVYQIKLIKLCERQRQRKGDVKEKIAAMTDVLSVSDSCDETNQKQAIISIVARSWRSSTRTYREFKWEGASEISSLWDELDEQSLKHCLDGVLSGPLSQDEQCSQVSTIARTLLAVALRRGIDSRSIFAEAVKTTTKLLDPTSEVPADLLSFRNSIFARWGEKDNKRGEMEVLMDRRNGLFARIRSFFHPRRGKTREDGQAPGVCIALAFLVTWSGNWRRAVEWKEDWAVNVRAAGADFVAGSVERDFGVSVGAEPMQRISGDTGIEVERGEGEAKAEYPTKAVPKDDAGDALKVKILLDQVECGLRRRDSDFLKGVFAQFSEGGPFLTKQQLTPALNEAGIDLDGEDAVVRFAAADCGEFVSVEEFLQLTKKLRKSNEWSGLLELHELLLDALPSTSSEHPLLVISELSSDEILCVCEAYCHGLKEELKKLSNQLRMAFEETKKHALFHKDLPRDQQDSKFLMALHERGLVDDKGQNDLLDELCQSQYNLAKQPVRVIYESMKIEHCSKPDSETLFSTSDSKTSEGSDSETSDDDKKTSSRREWDIVIEHSKHEGKRVVPDIKVAVSKCGSMVTKEEIISVVLYTGPMFKKYNCVLRQWPADLYDSLKGKDSLYTTTICVLVSALVKIARLQGNTLERRALYRGLSGEDPFAHWLPYHSGRSLTSTTEDHAVAVKFSGIKKGKPWPTVYEISSGDLQHGADISFFSQYPDQKEVLFPPFCKFTPIGMQLQFSSRTLVSKVNMSIHLNHHFQSLDDLREKNKLIHEQVLKTVLNELERELHWEMEHSKKQSKTKSDGSLIINKILEQCRAHMKTQCDHEAQKYFDDNDFRWLFKQTMDIKEMGRGKFSRWIETDEVANLDMGLLEWQREWSKIEHKQLSLVKGEERANFALALCRRLGLIRHDVTEHNEIGETPLLSAAARGERPFHLELLVMAKADIAAYDLGLHRGVLHLAAIYGHSDAVATLVQLGASITARDSAGLTPLDVALQCGNAEVALALKSVEMESVSAQE